MASNVNRISTTMRMTPRRAAAAEENCRGDMIGYSGIDPASLHFLFDRDLPGLLGLLIVNPQDDLKSYDANLIGGLYSAIVVDVILNRGPGIKDPQITE